MASHYIVHMKNGRELTFDSKAHYVSTLSDTNIIAIMEHKHGDILALIPPENVLWIEVRVTKE